MDIPNDLVYKCGTDVFRHLVDSLEKRRIKKWGISDFGNLSAVISDPPFIVLVFENGMWLPLAPMDFQGRIGLHVDYSSTLDYILGHDKTDQLRSVLSSTRLLAAHRIHILLKELKNAKRIALEHQEREQLKKLREKYPDEVSQ